MNAILQNKLRLHLSEIKEKVPLAGYTTFGIGGDADYFCVVKTREDLGILLKWCKDSNLPFLIIGSGSNLLVSEKGFGGLVIKLGGDFKKITHDQKTLTAGAGVSLPLLLQKAKTYLLGG